MNEEKIREIVEKVLADNMPNKDEIMKKAIEAVKEAEKKENDKPWLIKKGEEYLVGGESDETLWWSETNYANEENKLDDLRGLITRTKNELREVIKARKMQRAYEQWCMEYPVDWTNEKQPKYYACYLPFENKVDVLFDLTIQQQGTVYCASEEHIRGFIANYGHDFEKYVLGVGLPKYFLEV